MYWNMNEDVGDDFCKMQLKQNVRTEGLGSMSMKETATLGVPVTGLNRPWYLLSTVTVTSNTTRAVSHFQVAAALRVVLPQSLPSSETWEGLGSTRRLTQRRLFLLYNTF